MVGVYLPTTDALTDDFKSCLYILEDLINKHEGPVVLAGDFNSHVGPEGGDKALGSQNLHGRLLLEMVQNNDLFITSLSSMSSGPAYTFFRGDTYTTTDYIITDAKHAHLITQCQTLVHNALNFSDHLPLSLNMSLTSNTSSTNSTSSKLRLNWRAALEDGSAETYAKCVDNIVCPYLGKTYNSISSLDEDICQVSTSILQAAQSIIPKQKPKKRKKRFSNNPELKSLSIKCKHAWKKWKKAGCPSQGPSYEEKKSLSRETKKCANECRAAQERKCWKQREMLFKSKDARRFKTPSNQPSLGERLMYEGKIISDLPTIQSCWINHFKSLFQSRSESDANLLDLQNDMSRLDSLSKMNYDDIIDEEFSTEEIEVSIRKLKPNKAGGHDGLLSEHIKFGGPLLTLWLKEIFCTFSRLEQIPPSLLTGIICPIYKGRGKDPLACNSYRGITITSVLMKIFEYTLLNRLLPVLKEFGHPSLTQTAYQKNISCQDAIFATQEVILSNLRDDRVCYLSFYDLEKAFDSIEHCVLLHSLFEAGVNGKAWRLIRACYNNLSSVVRSGSTLSAPFAVTRGVQQGSVLSPTFFLIVMDGLLHRLRESSAGISMCGLFLGGAAHADDVRAIASSATAAEQHSQILHNFAAENGLKLNSAKTEVVKISKSNSCEENHLQLEHHLIQTVPQAGCLGYQWSHNLSAKPCVESNINKARRQFFALGSSGAFLGHSNPLASKEVYETCVVPTLLYGAENWILDENCLNLLECFQAEIGRRILKLSRFHSNLSTRIGLALPSILSRILKLKLGYLQNLLFSKEDTIATTTFKIIASQNVYNMSLVKQCIFLDSKLKTNCTSQILSNTSSLCSLKKCITTSDQHLLAEEASKHQSVCLAAKINWLRVWEAARDKGPYWTQIAQSFYKILTRPLFGERHCPRCNSHISENISFFEHLTKDHVPDTISISNLLADLYSPDSEPVSSSFHCMKSLLIFSQPTS